jgi:hypothetical protein
MSEFKFLNGPAPRVLVDIEALYDFNKVVLDAHEAEFGVRAPPTWTGTEFPITRNLSTKYGKRITTYFKKPGFFANLPIEDYALRGLFRMETLGFDVYIVISMTSGYLPALIEQLGWLEKKFPESWHSKFLVSRDKTLLSADYLVDVSPNVLETYDLFKKRGSTQFSRPSAVTPSWKLVLVDRPFNTSFSACHARFGLWEQWTNGFKDVLNLSLRDTMVSFAHGSPNSLDEDRLFLFPGSLINCVIGDQMRAILDDGIVDVNLMDLDEDGYVCENHKGQNDEIHNAFQTTYPLHPQRFPLPPNLGPRVQRLVALKYYSGMRRIFIRLTEVEATRSFMKETLRNHHPLVASPAFDKLDFSQILPLTNIDHAKTFAFQMGQIMGLFDGLDLFTKNDIVQAYPTLEPFIMRRREESLRDAYKLNEFRDELQLKTKFLKILVGPHHTGLLYIDPAASSINVHSSWYNSLLEQASGMVIDFKDLTVLAFPPTFSFAPLTLQWPRDPANSSDSAVLPRIGSVSLGKESHGHIIASDGQFFDSSLCQSALRLVSTMDTSQWPWKSRYLFFDITKDDKLQLVAARSKFSNLFLSRQRLDLLAVQMGLTTPNPTESESPLDVPGSEGQKKGSTEPQASSSSNPKQ